MTKYKDSLKKVLNNIQIPEPDEEARNRAISAAVAEFRQKKTVDEKKGKGISWIDRLMDKTHKGGPFMKKSIAVPLGFAVSFLVVAAIMLPNFVSYRMSSESVIMSPPALTVYRDQSSSEAFQKTMPSAPAVRQKPEHRVVLSKSAMESVQKEVRTEPLASTPRLQYKPSKSKRRKGTFISRLRTRHTSAGTVSIPLQ